jgi:chromosome segregation ATPase
MQKDNEQLRIDYKILREQLDRVLQEMRSSEANTETLRNQVAVLTREKESLSRTLENSQTSLDALSNLQGEYYSKQKEAETQIKDLNKLLEQANRQITQEQAIAKQLEMQYLAAQQRYDVAEEKRNKLDAAYSQIEGLLKGQKREAFEMIKLLEEEIGSLKLEVIKTNTGT